MKNLGNDLPAETALHWQSKASVARSAAAGAGDPLAQMRMRAAADDFERLAAEAGARQAVATLRSLGRSGPACSAGWHYALR